MEDLERKGCTASFLPKENVDFGLLSCFENHFSLRESLSLGADEIRYGAGARTKPDLFFALLDRAHDQSSLRGGLEVGVDEIKQGTEERGIL